MVPYRTACFGLAIGLAVEMASLAGLAHAQTREAVHTTIDAAVSGDRITGRATFRIPRFAVSDGQVRLGLALAGGRIDVGAVGDSARRTAAFRLSADGDTAAVPVPGGAPEAVVTVDFATPFDTASRRQLGYHLFNATEERDAWYPAILGLADSLARFRSFDVSIEVPRGVGLLATGALTDSVSTGSGMQYQFRSAGVEGVALAFGPGYRVTAVTQGGTTIRAFAPAAQTATFRRVATAAAEAAAWYRATYGFFPAEEIGVVPGYPGARGGFPLPQLFMIHQGDLSAPFVRWITAHELAHYYWGLWVLDADERLGWLALALGIWTDQLYLARTGNRSLPEQWRALDGDNSFQNYAEAMIANYDQRLGLAADVVDSLPYDYNSLVRHGKAATGIYLAAERVGADRFVAIQRDLLTSHRRRPLGAADLGRALEAAGFSGATAFLAAWSRADARLDYAARGVRPDTATRGAYWIRIERTGTVPYPTVIEVRPSRGPAVRAAITGEREIDSVRVELTGWPAEIRFDPEGTLPMRSSAHPGMRRVFLRAMGDAGPVDDFLSLAERHLRTDPDPHLASQVIERLFERGKNAAVFETAQRLPQAVSCVDRQRCFAALLVARALARLGKPAAAQVWIRQVEPAITQFGVAGARRLAEAKREAGVAR